VTKRDRVPKIKRLEVPSHVIFDIDMDDDESEAVVWEGFDGPIYGRDGWYAENKIGAWYEVDRQIYRSDIKYFNRSLKTICAEEKPLTDQQYELVQKVLNAMPRLGCSTKLKKIVATEEHRRQMSKNKRGLKLFLRGCEKL
jgi:hypothetical protein